MKLTPTEKSRRLVRRPSRHTAVTGRVASTKTSSARRCLQCRPAIARISRPNGELSYTIGAPLRNNALRAGSEESKDSISARDNDNGLGWSMYKQMSDGRDLRDCIIGSVIAASIKCSVSRVRRGCLEKRYRILSFVHMLDTVVRRSPISSVGPKSDRNFKKSSIECDGKVWIRRPIWSKWATALS